MVEHFKYRRPIFWVLLQHLVEQIFQGLFQVVGEYCLVILDLLVDLNFLPALERRSPEFEDIERHPQRPNISFLGFNTRTRNSFRSHIQNSPAESLALLGIHVRHIQAQPKIDELDRLQILTADDILQLDIPMRKGQGVQIENPRTHSFEYFFESLSIQLVSVEMFAHDLAQVHGQVLQNKVPLLLCALALGFHETVVVLDEIRVIQLFDELVLDVVGGDYFDGNEPVCKNILGLVDHSRQPSPDYLLQLVAPFEHNLFLLAEYHVRLADVLILFGRHVLPDELGVDIHGLSITGASSLLLFVFTAPLDDRRHLIPQQPDHLTAFALIFQLFRLIEQFTGFKDFGIDSLFGLFRARQLPFCLAHQVCALAVLGFLIPGFSHQLMALFSFGHAAEVGRTGQTLLVDLDAGGRSQFTALMIQLTIFRVLQCPLSDVLTRQGSLVGAVIACLECGVAADIVRLSLLASSLDIADAPIRLYHGFAHVLRDHRLEGEELEDLLFAFGVHSGCQITLHNITNAHPNPKYRPNSITLNNYKQINRLTPN